MENWVEKRSANETKPKGLPTKVAFSHYVQINDSN